MSDIGNMVAGVTQIPLDEVVDLVDLPRQDGSDHSLIGGERFFFADLETTFGLGFNVTGKRGPAASISFDAYPRGLEVTEDMLAIEADVVMAFLGSPKIMPSGFYGFEDLPFLQWDWDDYGVRFNSHPEWWHRIESRVLRKRLHEAGLPFEAHRWTTMPAKSGLRWWPEGAEKPVRLWAWHRIGADELRASLDLLAATVGVAGAFTTFYTEANSYNVEIEALEELVRQIVATAEAEQERLDVQPSWRDVLTSAVALLVNSGRPLPAVLTGSWEPLVAEATALAPQLLENPNPLVS